MHVQRARRGRGNGGEGAEAAIGQLVRLLEKGIGKERYPLIANKARVALGWARPEAGENHVGWLCRQLPEELREPVLRSLGHVLEEDSEEPETPAQNTVRRSGRRSRRGR